ncbi:MAG: hypothetical protein ACTSPS_14575 [Promethearchaeota archaeon]
MSEVKKWHYMDWIPKREKLMKLLFGEMVFLKRCLTKTSCKCEKQIIRIACGKVEYLLNKVDRMELDLTEREYNEKISRVYYVIKEIIEGLDEKAKYCKKDINKNLEAKAYLVKYKLDNQKHFKNKSEIIELSDRYSFFKNRIIECKKLKKGVF